MSTGPESTPGISVLLTRLAQTFLGVLQNRAELFAVELQEEKNRFVEVMVWGVALAFFGFMALAMLTAAILLLFDPPYRVYAAGGFAVLYMIAAVFAFTTIRRLLKNEPFAETTRQVKKDAEWLKSLK